MVAICISLMMSDVEYPFHVAFDCLCVFFRKMLRFSAHFLIRLLFAIELYEFIVPSGYEPFSDTDSQILSPIW